MGAADSAWLEWAFLSGLHTLPSTGLHTANFTMTLPIPRGPYELRWFHTTNGYNRILTSAAIQSEVRTRTAAGDAHTLVVRSDGTVWASGLNASGQLGDDSTTDRATPIQVFGVSDIVSVAAGVSHSMALKADGSVYVWGANDVSQVGDGSFTQRLTPTLLSLSDVVAIAAGDHHSLALTGSGQVFAWGLNDSGQLGNGTQSHLGATPYRDEFSSRLSRSAWPNPGSCHCLRPRQSS